MKNNVPNQGLETGVAGSMIGNGNLIYSIGSIIYRKIPSYIFSKTFEGSRNLICKLSFIEKRLNFSSASG